MTLPIWLLLLGSYGILFVLAFGGLMVAAYVVGMREGR